MDALVRGLVKRVTAEGFEDHFKAKVCAQRPLLVSVRYSGACSSKERMPAIFSAIHPPHAGGVASRPARHCLSFVCTPGHALLSSLLEQPKTADLPAA